MQTTQLKYPRYAAASECRINMVKCKWDTQVHLVSKSTLASWARCECHDGTAESKRLYFLYLSAQEREAEPVAGPPWRSQPPGVESP